MKLIYNPSVYLVGRQQLDTSGLKDFLDAHDITWESDAPSAGEYLAESAGRLCYLSYSKPRPGGNKAYLDNILASGHGSVVESVVFNFIITGVSRSLTHELVRHRSGVGFSQLSQRYVDESVAEYVVPDALKEEVQEARITFKGIGQVWLSSIYHSHEAYKGITSYLFDKLSDITNPTERRKAARQAARSVLPNATETKIFFTVNARALRHIIEMRASRHAEVEIRKLAYQLWEIAVKECPNLFGDYEEVKLADGTVELVTKNRKV